MGRKLIREVLSAPLTAEELQRRQALGWRAVAVEWERDAVPGEPPGEPTRHELPYGLRIAGDCLHLEDNLEEIDVMLAALECIIRDYPLSRVASDLNNGGHRMRDGAAWTPSAVFELLPRLIEFGPRVFSREEWAQRRRRLMQAV